MEKSKKALITGGYGYIGSHLLWHLHHEGYELWVIDDARGSYPEQLQLPPHNLVDSDICEVGSAAMETHFPNGLKVDFMCHLAADSSVTQCNLDPLQSYKNNILGTISAVRLAERLCVDYFVFASTAGVYGVDGNFGLTDVLDPASSYAKSKWMCEKIIEDWSAGSRTDVTIFRFFNVAGASVEYLVGELRDHDDHLIPRLLSAVFEGGEIQVYGDDYPTYDGSCIRDYVHVDDLCEAVVLSINRRLDRHPIPDILNVGSGTGVSVFEVVKRLEVCLRLELEVRSVDRRAGDPPRLVADISSSTDVLGWRPLRDLDTIIKSSWNWRTHVNSQNP